MYLCERCARGWFEKPIIKKDRPFIPQFRSECDKCKHIKQLDYFDDEEKA
jgi:hypothetical protein